MANPKEKWVKRSLMLHEVHLLIEALVISRPQKMILIAILLEMECNFQS